MHKHFNDKPTYINNQVNEYSTVSQIATSHGQQTSSKQPGRRTGSRAAMF